VLLTPAPDANVTSISKPDSVVDELRAGRGIYAFCVSIGI
jgi:hypothetical protein